MQGTFHGRFTGAGDLASEVFTNTVGRHNHQPSVAKTHQEGTMDSSKTPNRTPEQKTKTTKTAKDETVELSVEELEERIAPRTRN
jgi:hypothetical protein